ncbi:MAG: hypothetical protein COC23_06090 [Hyphomicrobiales bacterium]|nr:MAG: hypothetical protein COC23_06090 [Hyphomicrobiales bacterium]
MGLLVLGSGNGWAADSHAGYYYPKPQSREAYVSSASTRPNATKLSRVGFTVGLNNIQQKRGYAPRFHLFAKGANGQKLIIVATGDNTYNTLYRLRALLAGLTADARASQMFRNLPSPEDVNFLDLCKMIGFTQVTLSDGKELAHRITLP